MNLTGMQSGTMRFKPATRKRLPVPNYEGFGVSLLGEICGELGIKPLELMEI